MEESAAFRKNKEGRDFETLTDLLRERAEGLRADRGYNFFGDSGEIVDRLSYRELDRVARRLAYQLMGGQGERCLLLFPPGLDYIAAFFACLYAGVVAVPAYPPSRRSLNDRFRSVLRDAAPRWIFAPPDITRRVQRATRDWPEMGDISWLEMGGRETGPGAPDHVVRPEPSSLAFLQYTSGSTSAPKGVRVTHGNLLHNEQLIHRCFATGSDSVILGWLPLYHDMGLIGNVLQPLYLGAECHLMAPLTFLQRPMSWLEAISKQRATVSGGPNFAYELCAEKATDEEVASLDLSSWQVAFNGSEPVRAATMDAFAERFRPCGFEANAFYPCYGLAEATLFVSGGEVAVAPTSGTFDRAGLESGVARPAAEGRCLASSGRPAPNLEVVVADSDSSGPLPEGKVGEIWVAGESIADGYWNRPEVNREVFGARLPGREHDFLRTGDLGFLWDGELFLSGRLKDLLILRGRNVYPQDLERIAAGSHPALVADGGAAFSVDLGDGEMAVVVQEIGRRATEEEARQALQAIAAEVAEREQVRLHEVVLLRERTLPKTSSGKVQRGRCREAWLAGELEVVARSGMKASEVEEGEEVPPLYRLVAACCRSSPSELETSTSLVAAGLDSLAAMELSQGIAEEFGVEVPLVELLASPTLEELEALLAAQAPVGKRTLRNEPTEALSAGQEALFFFESMHPEASVYNIARAFTLAPGLGPRALRRALEAVVERHRELCLCFPTDAEGAPRRRPATGPFVEGTKHQAESWSEEVLDRALAEAAWRPFDLERGPLVRLEIFHRREGAVVLFVAHHLVADFHSLIRLARELGAELEGAAVDGPDHTYDAFVHAERLLLDTSGESLLAAWRERLEPLPPTIELPVDRDPGQARSRRAGVAFQLGGEPLAADVRRLAADRGVTPFTVVLTAVQLLLARLADAKRSLVVSPVATPGPLPPDGVVGYRVNPLPFVLDCGGDPDFGILVDATREGMRHALAHRDLPFAHLAAALGRGGSGPSLFRVLFAFYEMPPGMPSNLGDAALGRGGTPVELGPFALQVRTLEERRTAYDLSFGAHFDADELVLALEYDTDLFDRCTAERLLERLQRLLAAGLAEPALPASALELLSSAERRQLLARGDGGGRLDGGPVDGLAGLVLGRGREIPEAIAVVHPTGILSYGELICRVEFLAAALREAGVQPEERVGVCLPRTLDLVVALLAVLRAGGAYVPLDPTYPEARLGQIAQDSGVHRVIGVGPLAHRLGKVLSPTLRGRGGTVASPVDPRRLAYLIYTSGSTGVPKGVAVSHGAAGALLGWARTVFAADELRLTLAATSIAFDLSIFELFLPLSEGHTLALADNALTLLDLPVAHRITLVNTVPSALDALLEAGALPAGVRTVNLAGEALQRSLVNRIHAARPGARVLNLYGPSEDTTYSTFVEVPRGTDEAPTVGRPIAGSQAYVVDRHFNLRPDGAVGELVLGGAGVARGYLGRAALTAEAFVPDPFSAAAGARLYRTGDLVAWDAEDELRFLGRRDHQVKIRGFRIELGEIEAQLLSVPEVAEVAVVARSHAAGPALVAYVVAPELNKSEEALRTHLESFLPVHMVPKFWVILEVLPRTANGKLDRAQLPEPSHTPNDNEAPTDPYATTIATIFAELLGLEVVGSEDDFFTLGGHSLLATRLAAQLRRSLGVDVPVSAVFGASTPSALARRLRQLAERPVPPAPVLPEVGEEPVPLSPAQEKMWLHQQLDPASPVYHLAGVMELEGRLDRERLSGAWGVVLDRHPVLRVRFRADTGTQVMVMEPAVDHPLEERDGQRSSAEEIEGWTTEIVLRPLDLAAEGPLRVVLISRGVEHHRLVIVLHHLAADGESLRLLIDELRLAYDGQDLDPVPDFRSWALGQRELLAVHGEAAARREVPPQLPLDHPRPARPDFAGRKIEGWLPAATAAALTRLGRAAGGSLFTALFATCQLFLARLGGTSRPLLGTPLAGRGDGLENMVGPLVNSLTLSGEVHRERPMEELLAAAVRRLLTALDRQHLAVGGGEAPESVFTLERRWPCLRLGEAFGDVFPRFTETAKFDLTLTVVEAAEGDLPVSMEVRRELIDTTTARRWLESWVHLATAAADRPWAAQGELSWLSAAERHQLLVEWNDSQRAETAVSVPARIAAVARRLTHAVAVMGEGKGKESWHLTYGALLERADALAQRLLDLGPGREPVVGVRMERSPELFVALFGVLRAGAAYLPLDPTLPDDRLAAMVDDAAVVVLYAEGGGRIGMEYGMEEGAAAARPSTAGTELPTIDDQQLAYVIYTSGSTGVPKGVMISHRGLRHLVDWHCRVYGPAVGDQCTQLAGLGFDAAVWEIWPCLASGATLCAVEEPVRSTPALLAEHLLTRRVTGTFLPTPLAEAFLAEALRPGVGLRHVLTGGDQLRSSAGEAGFALINHYGPTECSVVTTAGPVLARLTGALPDIGRPIDGLRGYAVAPDLRPMPVGVAGELVIAGVGLARGYLGKPALTARSFIPDPFAADGGQRLYRSGDRVRFATDGRIEFLGRTDRQVKVRGYRIEPGEVEVQLRALPGVDDALVTVHGAGEAARLVAHVVTSVGVDAAGLREALRPHLAPYMLPSAFLTLDAWPLTANGKIDRAALPLPESAEIGYVEPRSSFEVLLAGLWSELLEVEKVGVETPFYELGGNSLQVTRLLARVHEVCGIEVSVRDFLEDPTVVGLSRAVAQGLVRAADPDAAASALSEVRGAS